MSQVVRFCPLCERRFEGDSVCPEDGVPTVKLQATEPVLLPRLAAGTIFGGRYRIGRALGAGGMGEVYQATQLSVQRSVALKVLLDPGGAGSERRIKRFYKEAQAASALVHPNIVRVYDFGVDDATHLPFLVMEFVEGETLGALVKREGPLAERRAAFLLAQVARALVEAHQKGIVHRDLKPRNVMVSLLADGQEHVQLLDFGIARMRPPESDDDVPRLTLEGAIVGTPEYMSPEQTHGVDPDFRSDLYSLGCVLHELLTGRPPFTAKDPAVVMMMQVREAIVLADAPLADGQRPTSDLRELHAALLAKDHAERPASTAVVAQILSALAVGEQLGVARLLDAFRASTLADHVPGRSSSSAPRFMPRAVEASLAEPVAELVAGASHGGPSHAAITPASPTTGLAAVERPRLLGLVALVVALAVGAAIAAVLLLDRSEPLPAPVLEDAGQVAEDAQPATAPDAAVLRGAGRAIEAYDAGVTPARLPAKVAPARKAAPAKAREGLPPAEGERVERPASSRASPDAGAAKPARTELAPATSYP